MLVKESISFERYRDPKKALGLTPLDANFPEKSIKYLHDLLKTKVDRLQNPEESSTPAAGKYIFFWFNKNEKNFNIVFHFNDKEFSVFSAEKREIFSDLNELSNILKKYGIKL